MFRCRVACRIALRLPRQNACPDAVNAPCVETKVLHFPVHTFSACCRVQWADRSSWLAVVDVQRSVAGPLRRGPRQVGGETSAYTSGRPSRRVAASAPCNTFPYSISGYEREKDMVPE